MATRRTSRPTAQRRHRTTRTSSAQSLYRRPLRFEPLEDRRLLALVTVNTLNDSVDLNDGLTSLREAIFATNLVAGPDTIDFAPALTAAGPATILLTQGELKITDSLTINGPGADLLTIDASGNDPTPDVNDGNGSRIFNIDDGKANLMDVFLSGLTLTGCDLFSAGVILVRENLNLTRVSVIENSARISAVIEKVSGLLQLNGCIVSANVGMAVRSVAGDVDIANSTLSDQSLMSPGMSGISIVSGNLRLTASTISDNAGGIGVSASNGRVEIVDSTISRNARGISAQSADVFLINSVVSDHRANFMGLVVGSSGIVVENGSLTLSGSNILRNVATNLNQGGGISARNARVTIVGSSISLNEAPSGAGLRIAGGDAEIIRSTISDNNSDVHFGTGSGAGLIGLSTNLRIVDSTISGNLGSGSSGVKWYGEGSFHIEDSTVENNYGAAIRVSPTGGTATINRCTINDNGRGVHATSYNGGSVTIADTSISGNSNGGGIYVRSLTGGPTSITRCTISGNTRAFTGGGIYLQSGNTLISDSEITGNTTTYLGSRNRGGGGVYVAAGAMATISDSEVSENYSRGQGGGILNNGNVTILHTTISANESESDGGGLALFGTATISESQISNNLSGGQGAGVYASPFSPQSIVRSTVYGNTAEGSGGGVFAAAAGPGRFSINESTISENSTSGDGGGIWFGSLTSVSNCLISDNTSGRGGGAYMFGGAVLRQSTVTGNSASIGGGVYAASPGRFEFSTIASNSATDFGGGAFIRFGTLTINHSIVAQNVAPAGSDITGLLGAAISPTYSLIGRNGGTGLTPAPVGLPDANGNLIGGSTNALRIDPLLGPLVNNGGPTMTHALLPGSPAINAGDLNATAGVGDVPLYDRRGYPFSRVFGGRIDIGAFEAQPNPLPGDYNFNGIVDLADSVIWRDTRGSTTDLRADGNEDGVVNDADRAIWMANFGKTRSGELVLAISASAMGLIPRQPPALPGVSPAVNVATVTNSDNARPPAEPGAAGSRMTSDHRDASARKNIQAVSTTSLKQDAALVAWLASRTVHDDLRNPASRPRPPMDPTMEDATTSNAGAIDRVFDEVGKL